MLGNSGWWLERFDGEFDYYELMSPSGVFQTVLDTGLAEAITAALAPKPLVSDEECAREIAALGVNWKGTFAKDVLPIIAAHRTAAEKKAKAEAMEEAAQIADKLGEGWYADYKEDNSNLGLWRGDGAEMVAEAIRAILNQYKETV